MGKNMSKAVAYLGLVLPMIATTPSYWMWVLYLMGLFYLISSMAAGIKKHGWFDRRNAEGYLVFIVAIGILFYAPKPTYPPKLLPTAVAENVESDIKEDPRDCDKYIKISPIASGKLMSDYWYKARQVCQEMRAKNGKHK